MSELGPEAREILEAGRIGDEPTAADRRRVRASVMQAIAAGGAGGLASSAAAKASAAGLKAGAVSVWKIVVGLTVATAVAGGVASRFTGEAPRPSTTAVAAVSAPIAPAPPPPEPAASAPIAAPTAEPSASAPQPVASPARPSPHPVAPRPRAPAAPVASTSSEAPAAPPPPPEDTLAAEAAELREAHRAMQGGDPARALAVLDGRQAKGNALREEREAARVLALCQLGRVDEARAAAARFLQSSPRSPLADRVRGACPAR
jgi:hypothetical protein